MPLPTPLRPIHVSDVIERCNLVVCDLAPWDDESVNVVRALKDGQPLVSVLIYVPPTEAAARLLLSCPANAADSVLVQQHDSAEIVRLKRAIAELIDHATGTKLAVFMTRLIPYPPPEVKQFIATAIRQIRCGRCASSVTVNAISRQLRLSPRTLERIWSRRRLPAPKVFLDWLILLLVYYEARTSSAPVGTVARTLGLDGQRLYRLKKRLIPDEVGLRGLDRNQILDLSIMAFAAACGSSRQYSSDVKEALIG